MANEDVEALEAGMLDDGGKSRLRAAFMEGRLAAGLAGRCEVVDGWVWAENPEHLASLQDHEFAFRYRQLRECMARVPAGEAMKPPFAVTAWVVEKRRMHEDGSLPLVEHAILQSTPGWAWSGPLRTDHGASAVQELESMLTDSAIAQELAAPDHIGFEMLGRLFRASRIGFKRAMLELYLEEFRRWNKAYPGYDVPGFATSRGVKLGRWVSKMRRRAHLDLLDAETFALLSDTPNWRWGLFDNEPVPAR